MSIYDRVPLDISALDRLFDIRDKALDVKRELTGFVSEDTSKMNTRQEGLKSIQTVMKMVDYVFNYRFCYVGFEADLVKIQTCLSDAEYYLSFIYR
ncbi:NR LBD domain-containing protein [Caenorhabditis elegans]|uniref:NR LBD domain-containing protein n=1 Tax=Caenorhabditis elegans TaxID=6239 RepID=Q18133_CAEEL|nr:NR LBD domain-containing protein [Caenorhabditis elegans]CCD65558.1 NR LBD domain-containing protein [Caenorhabditis elegans]|eukprot:NP_508861.2 Uncharacterized protein CELE_C24H10.3 [Caenorhabditis elegans]